MPKEVLLLPQILQRMNNEHSLLLAPYCLNSAQLITELGFNAKVLGEGFNQRNRKERETAFHGETLKHVLNSVDSDAMIEWFNQTLFPYWQAEALHHAGKRGVTRQFIMDGMKIEVPAHLKHKYEGAGTVKNEDGSYSHGYKVVWIQQVLHPVKKGLSDSLPAKRGILIALRIGPIEEHDSSLGKWVAREFPFQKGDELIIDRGFIDADWFNHLHEERGVDVTVPVRRNMNIAKNAIIDCLTMRNHAWEPHPIRPDQWVQSLTEEDLKVWKECRVMKSGVIVKWKKPNGVFEHVVFLSTKKRLTPEQLLSTYDGRSRIEETHRQIKVFQGIEKLPSKKWAHVVFRILMGVVAFNLVHLFLMSQKCETLSQAETLKTLRQKRDRKKEQNPLVILYTESAFAVIAYRDLVLMLLDIEDPAVKQRLKRVWSMGSA